MAKPIALLLLVASFLVLSCHRSTESNTERLCKDFQKDAREINRQAPITIDYVTTLTGVSGIYSAGVCTITYYKLINEGLFITEIIRESRHSEQSSIFNSRSKVIAVFNTDEGRAHLSSIFIKMLPEEARYRGSAHVEQYHQISFDGGNIKPLRVLVGR